MIINKLSNKEKQIINKTLEIKPTIYFEDRRYFAKPWNAKYFINEINSDTWFLPDNQSFSEKGTLERFHYQLNLTTQVKYLVVKKGILFDYKFDLSKKYKTLKNNYLIRNIKYKNDWIKQHLLVESAF